MTHFKIISCGWKSWPWIERTLTSIDMQEHRDFDVCVVDDNSEDPVLSGYIETYCKDRNWNFILRTERTGALINQVEGIRLMNPEPDDVIVFLDSDGDRFAHNRVLSRLEQEYADGTQVAYSKYKPEPASPGSAQSRPYPSEVIASNSYRKFTLTSGIYWNHLRTMRAETFLQIEDSDLRDRKGNYFFQTPDSVLMFPALELARGRVKFIDEVLLIYRADHELSEWMRDPATINRINEDILTRPPKCRH